MNELIRVMACLGGVYELEKSLSHMCACIKWWRYIHLGQCIVSCWIMWRPREVA